MAIKTAFLEDRAGHARLCREGLNDLAFERNLQYESWRCFDCGEWHDRVSLPHHCLSHGWTEGKLPVWRATKSRIEAPMPVGTTADPVLLRYDLVADCLDVIAPDGKPLATFNRVPRNNGSPIEVWLCPVCGENIRGSEGISSHCVIHGIAAGMFSDFEAKPVQPDPDNEHRQKLEAILQASKKLHAEADAMYQDALKYWADQMFTAQRMLEQYFGHKYDIRRVTE